MAAPPGPPLQNSGGRKNMEALKFSCTKCGNTTYEISEFRATGGFFAKIFDVQTKKFSTVSCIKCKYTEIYKADSSMLGNIFDFFTD